MQSTEELKAEQSATKEKLTRVISFINSEEFYSLPDTERNYITQERAGLELYLDALTKRAYSKESYLAGNNMMLFPLMMSMFNTSSMLPSIGAAKEVVDAEDKDNLV
jgi:hypothetical protein